MKSAVWGSTYNDAKAKLFDIEEEYAQMGIYPIKGRQGRIETSYKLIINFENGDYWETVPTIENSRGYALNVSYIQEGIDPKIIDCVIEPATKAFPYQAFNYYN